MINMGLTTSQRLAFEALLVSPHHVDIKIQLMDLNHNYIANVSKMLSDGQVDLDAAGDVTRTLNLTLWDPKHTLNLDSNSPDDGAMFMDRMIRVIYVVSPPDGSVFYSCPIFTGPITKVDRATGFITVEASGKDHLAYVSVWDPTTYKKGTKKTSVARDVLGDIGETKMRIPSSTATLAKDLGYGHDSVPWKTAKSVLRSMGRQLFYDALGYAVGESRSNRSVFTFGERHIVNEPQIGYQIEELVNAVKVIGGKPKGAKKKVQVTLVADRKHPLSPWSLGRNGKPRYLMDLIEDESIKTIAEAREVAKSRLDRGLLEGIEVSFDSLVVPHLEVNDVFRVYVNGAAVQARYRTASIPLMSSVGSVGYIKNLRPNKRSIRRNIA